MDSYEECVNIASSIGEEVLTRKELEYMFANMNVNAYDGFELSGIPHIAQVTMKSLNVNKLAKCGCKFKFWVADIFTMLNNKMGGDSDKIKIVGEYMIEVWKAAGMKMENVEFLWASEEINKNSEYYWKIVIDVARKYSLSRMKRCIPILGRSKDVMGEYETHKARSEEFKKAGDFESALKELELANEALEKVDDNIPLSYLLYAAMQTADVFFIDAQICQLGMDQKKVNVLARDYCDKFNREKKPIVQPRCKPVIISHHMLMGLQQGQEKMSKSDPNSGIFVTDTAAQVKNKIKKAYCVPGDITSNPVLDYTKHIIFPYLEESSELLVIEQKFGDTLELESYDELEQLYLNGDIHPSDLKPAVSREITKLLDPIRTHFETDERAKDLLKKVKSFKITR